MGHTNYELTDEQKLDNINMNAGTTQTYTEWKNNLSNETTDEIYDEDVVKEVKNFMLAPCCMYQGKMYAAAVQVFKDLSEIKEFFKVNSNILLYKIMVTGNIYSIRYAQL